MQKNLTFSADLVRSDLALGLVVPVDVHPGNLDVDLEVHALLGAARPDSEEPHVGHAVGVDVAQREPALDLTDLVVALHVLHVHRVEDRQLQLGDTCDSIRGSV